MYNSKKKILTIISILLFSNACFNKNNEPNSSNQHEQIKIDSAKNNNNKLFVDSESMAYNKLIHDDTLKCNVDILLPISDSLRKKKLTDKQVDLFLHTLNKLCNTNVEYSEWSNEILFDILKWYPVKLITIIEREKGAIDTDYILDDLKSPVNDGIDVKLIYTKVRQANISGELKNRILSSLDTAIVNGGINH